MGTSLVIVTTILLLDLYFLKQLNIPSKEFQILKYAFYTFSFRREEERLLYNVKGTNSIKKISGLL